MGLRQDPFESLIRNCGHDEIEGTLFPVHSNRDSITARLKRINRSTQMNGSATLRDVICRLAVEIGKWNRGHSHASGFGRFQEGITKYHRPVIDAHPVEFFVKCADKDGS